MHRLSMYSPISSWKKGDFPTAPFVYLSLGTYSSDSDGRILISPQLMSDQEIDEVVDQLKGELEEFRKKAKNELKVIRKKIRATLQEKSNGLL